MFNSIQDLKSTNTNASEAEVFGYYKPGDGGGGLFYWDANSTEAGNGGTVIRPTYSGFGGTGRWKRPNQDLANVKQFGIGFSPNFDEEDAFYKVINNFNDIYIPENTTVKLGTSSLHNTNIIGKKTIRGAGYTSVIEHYNQESSNSFPLHLRGQKIGETSLSIDAAKNDDRIMVNDTSGASAGDLVFILSNDKREASQILEIDGSTLILADRFYRIYQAASSVVSFYHRAKIILKDFSMKFYNDKFAEAIRLEHGIDCDISGIQITRDRAFAEFSGGTGIYLRNSYNCSVHDNKIEWMNHTSRGYGVLFGGCRNCDITDNKIENCRSLDLSGVEKADDSDLRYDDTIHCLVQNNTIVSKYNQAQPNGEPNNTTRGLSTHAGAANLLTTCSWGYITTSWTAAGIISLREIRDAAVRSSRLNLREKQSAKATILKLMNLRKWVAA